MKMPFGLWLRRCVLLPCARWARLNTLVRQWSEPTIVSEQEAGKLRLWPPCDSVTEQQRFRESRWVGKGQS